MPLISARFLVAALVICLEVVQYHIATPSYLISDIFGVPDIGILSLRRKDRPTSSVSLKNMTIVQFVITSSVCDTSAGVAAIL